jgi:hypothetical protein
MLLNFVIIRDFKQAGHGGTPIIPALGKVR